MQYTSLGDDDCILSNTHAVSVISIITVIYFDNCKFSLLRQTFINGGLNLPSIIIQNVIEFIEELETNKLKSSNSTIKDVLMNSTTVDRSVETEVNNVDCDSPEISFNAFEASSEAHSDAPKKSCKRRFLVE